jgi:hypothetical protein
VWPPITSFAVVLLLAAPLAAEAQQAGEVPPTKLEFVINGRTAKAIGLTIPQSVLLRSDQVID